jgi:hypothetical protein
MAADGLLVISLGQIKVQESGRLLIRNVPYISSSGTQAFSKAI